MIQFKSVSPSLTPETAAGNLINSASVSSENYKYESFKNRWGRGVKEVNVKDLCSPIIISAWG